MTGEVAAVYVHPDTLLPWAGNPRVNEHAVKEVAESIRRYGFGSPIVARASNRTIICGHTRWKAARQLGLEKVPCRFLDVDERVAHELALVDNRTGEIATWDEAKLAEALQAMRLESPDLVLPAFDPGELARLAPPPLPGQGAPSGPPPAPDAPEPPAEPRSRRGELYLLGPHRLLCGDATKGEDVARLMGEERADLLATDPPYGVDYGVTSGPESAERFGSMTGDDADGPRLQAFLTTVFNLARKYLRDNAAWYLWHAQMTQGFFAAAAAAAQILIHRQIVWVKASLILGHGDYHWRHELCFYGWLRGHRARWFGDRSQTTVWEVARERSGNHPTQKPAELFARAINLSTLPGELCYEPFAGSGTQIIAAAQTGRRCFALEIEPKYCDVVRARWGAYARAAGLEPGPHALDLPAPTRAPAAAEPTGADDPWRT